MQLALLPGSGCKLVEQAHAIGGKFCGPAACIIAMHRHHTMLGKTREMALQGAHAHAQTFAQGGHGNGLAAALRLGQHVAKQGAQKVFDLLGRFYPKRLHDVAP